MKKTVLNDRQKHFLRFVYYMTNKYGTENTGPIWKDLKIYPNRVHLVGQPDTRLAFVYHLQIVDIIKRGWYNDREKKMLKRIRKHFTKQLADKHTKSFRTTPFDYYKYGYPEITEFKEYGTVKFYFDKDGFREDTEIWVDTVEYGTVDTHGNKFSGNSITINNPLNPGV